MYLTPLWFLLAHRALWYVENDAEFILLLKKEAAYMRMAVNNWLQYVSCAFKAIFSLTGGQVLPMVPMHSYYRQRSTKRSHTIVSISHHFRITNHCTSFGRLWSVRAQNIIGVHEWKQEYVLWFCQLTTSDIKWLGLRPSDLNKWVFVLTTMVPLEWMIRLGLIRFISSHRYDLPEQCPTYQK